MDSKKVDLIPVIVAVIPYVLLGYPWFSMFRDLWFEGGGLTVEQLVSGPGYIPAFSVAIISSIVMAYVLSFLIIKTGKRTAIRGFKISILIWLGFIAPLLGTQYIYEARSLAYFGITAGYPLLGLLIMGVIIGGWKSKQKKNDLKPE
ncbi:MAG: DUF1761 domain-containing protein [Calditrichaeota bacterium]|nr:MAG: DUF1761 domain-containing protein [Calditrichota bacterium]MBL1208014.1 DUF1761 domain-containing protein [Calditrichota bacterium]NOG47850.1 DUF1761 domain-containing protein [Calditrichota bacterium]